MGAPPDAGVWSEPVTVQLTRDEFRAAIKSRPPEWRRQLRMWGVLYLVAIVALLVVVGATWSDVVPGLMTAGITFLLLLALSRWMVHRAPTRPPRVYRFDDHGLDEIRGDHRRRLEYRDVRAVVTTGDLICLWFRRKAVALPRRCFPSTAMADAVVDAASTAH